MPELHNYLYRCELKLVTPGPSLTSALPGLGLVTVMGGLVLLLLLVSTLYTRARYRPRDLLTPASSLQPTPGPRLRRLEAALAARDQQLLQRLVAAPAMAAAPPAANGHTRNGDTSHHTAQ